MSVPIIYGQYATANLYLKKSNGWYLGLDIEDSAGDPVNVNSYAAVRLTATDSQSNVVINVSTNSGQISIVSDSSILINTNAVTTNINAGYYSYDLSLLANGVWQTVLTGSLRVDSSYAG